MARKIKGKRLPAKPSALIRLALADLAAVEKLQAYTVDMHLYHEPNGKCAVCFAGAVMAKTLKAAPDKSLYPDDFDTETRDKLFALDSFRVGDTETGLQEMGFALPRFIRPAFGWPHAFPTYAGNRQEFKAAMRELADTLEGVGL